MITKGIEAAVKVGGSASQWFSLYGFDVRSDFSLPLSPIREPNDPNRSWTFRRQESATRLPPVGDPDVFVRSRDGRAVASVSERPEGVWIWNSGIGAFRIAIQDRLVDVYPNAGVDERVLGLALVGQVAIYLLHRLGIPSLHASAVLTEHGAVGFLGPRGSGKSTMSAYLLRQGAVLLADDALPLRLGAGVVQGGPCLPIMRIWPDTADTVLNLQDALPDVLEHYPKKVLSLSERFDFARAPAPLRALYLLDRCDPSVTSRTGVETRRLSAREGVLCLVAQTSWRALLRPADMASHLPLYARLVEQADLAVLSFPTGFEHQPETGSRIIKELSDRWAG